jgi:hypothetical protein
MLGSWVPEPVAVCDIAVPLRLLSNAVDRIAITEGATEPDDNLTMISFRARTDFAVPMCGTTPHKLARISELGHRGLQYIFGVAVDMSIRRTLTARLKRYDVCFEPERTFTHTA